jgi:hypothetical protein
LTCDQRYPLTEVVAGLHIGWMHLIRSGVDVGLGTGTEPEPKAIEVVFAAGRAVPAGAQTQADPMHVVLRSKDSQ